MRILVLPVYNEENVIRNLIMEFLTLQPDLHVLVIDDHSSDLTAAHLLNIEDNRLIVIRNKVNLGHGLSVIKGLNKALEIGATVVITADGDGNYQVQDVLGMLDKFENSSVDVVEGIRTNRNDPWFRQFSSLVTRILVFMRSQRFTRDANTPFHAFRTETLRDILLQIPKSGNVIPNMYISSIIRSNAINFSTIEIPNFSRKGNNPLGVTWNQKNRNIPSWRYIKFCMSVTFDWFFSR